MSHGHYKHILIDVTASTILNLHLNNEFKNIIDMREVKERLNSYIEY